MRSECLTWTLILKFSPLGDVKDCLSLPSGRALSIETGISWLSLEPSVQGTKSSEEGIVVRERVTSRTEIPSVREPGINGDHEPIDKAQNSGSSVNSREIPVSMENVCPEGTEDQYVTYPSGEALGRNVNVMRSERIRKSPQRYNPGFGAARECKNDAVCNFILYDQR